LLELGADPVERGQSQTTPTETGVEIARRAGAILSAARDLADSAQHRGRLLNGSLRLGVGPTLAPHVLRDSRWPPSA